MLTEAVFAIMIGSICRKIFQKHVDIRIAGWYYIQVADEKQTSLNK